MGLSSICSTAPLSRSDQPAISPSGVAAQSCARMRRAISPGAAGQAGGGVASGLVLFPMVTVQSRQSGLNPRHAAKRVPAWQAPPKADEAGMPEGAGPCPEWPLPFFELLPSPQVARKHLPPHHEKGRQRRFVPDSHTLDQAITRPRRNGCRSVQFIFVISKAYQPEIAFLEVFHAMLYRRRSVAGQLRRTVPEISLTTCEP